MHYLHKIWKCIISVKIFWISNKFLLSYASKRLIEVVRAKALCRQVIDTLVFPTRWYAKHNVLVMYRSIDIWSVYQSYEYV